jgi:hypothetical protein
MRLHLLLLAASGLLLAACGGEPYTDADLTKALNGVDHVSSARAGCSSNDLSWRCMSIVELSPTADADDIAAAITKSARLSRPDKDEVTVRIGGTSSNDSRGRGATVTFTSPPSDAEAIAAGVVMAMSSNELGHTGFETDRDGMSITATFVPDTPVKSIAAVSRSLLDASGASSVRAGTPSADVRFTARAAADAWPDAELAVFDAVSDEYRVEKTVIRKGFLGILLGEGDDVEKARALASAQPGFGSIDSVIVTDDAEADLSNAGEAPLQGADMAEALAQLPGYLGVRLGDGSMRVTADSLAHAEAMDAMLQRKFGKAYARRDTTYEIQRVATVERPAGTAAWFDTARTLVDSGLFSVVQVGDAAPADGVRVIFVRAADGVTPAQASETIGRAWQPGRDVEVKLGWQADPPTTVFFSAGETISIKPSARVTEQVATAIESAWTRGRAAAG